MIFILIERGEIKMKENKICRITDELTVEYTLSRDEGRGERCYSILCEIFNNKGELLDSVGAEHFTADYDTAKSFFDTTRIQ